MIVGLTTLGSTYVLSRLECSYAPDLQLQIWKQIYHLFPPVAQHKQNFLVESLDIFALQASKFFVPFSVWYVVHIKSEQPHNPRPALVLLAAGAKPQVA